MLRSIGVLLFSFSITQSALAIPNLTANSKAPKFSKSFLNEAYDFKGIVALNNCSGSIVKFDDSLAEDKAMILTNGHCVSLLDPGVVLYNENSRRSFTILNESAQRIGTERAEKLVYATMTDTDLAIYQLAVTYQEISDDYEIEALTISREYAPIETPIEVISGYWRRGYSCAVEEIIYSLKEGDWLFKDSIRYSRPGCDVIGGTSGSPAINADTREVIGVNNTINESGRRCTLNNPCEIDEDGNVSYDRGLGYAQQINWLYSCRDADRKIDLSVDGCVLPTP